MAHTPQSMTRQELREAVARSLAACAEKPLAPEATILLNSLGYASSRRMDMKPNSAKEFRALFDQDDRMNKERARVSEWKTVDLIFQITDQEIRASNQIMFRFDSSTKVDDTVMKSYLFFAVDLSGESYTKTSLAEITREVNRLFAMPVFLVFRHERTISLAIINRRISLKDSARDILEKVTLIRDIRCDQPHRAHIEILCDLAISELAEAHGVTNYVELHRAWMKTLSSSEINRRFFREISNWYFWAVDTVKFPKDSHPDEHVRNSIGVIRLLTRLIFAWFMKEKGLIPESLFPEKYPDTILVPGSKDASAYYKAILQNLFFATLNHEIDGDSNYKREFRKDGKHYNVTTLYRYKRFFRDPVAALRLFATIPFLNGGLFECLDRPDKDDREKVKHPRRIDGFSDRDDNPLFVPDALFFADEHVADLNKSYGTKGRSYRIQGLIGILHKYKFTIDENTPIDEEVALDPELLGQVFENLLAEFNPETEETARKQTGSFYTPRDVVSFMVDEALLTYFIDRWRADRSGERDDAEARFRALLAFTPEQPFSPKEASKIIAWIDSVKILDPACGSGAFPMGILQKLVFLLGKLDAGNLLWKKQQLERATSIEDPELREQSILSVEDAFRDHGLDYGRKLFLIENCIHGTDIQPVAVQIAKLRCFISLIVEQKVDDKKRNRGVIPLPNLETKFVAADTLVGDLAQQGLKSSDVIEKEQELAGIRRRLFLVRQSRTKEQLRRQDEKLRAEILDHLVASGLSREQGVVFAQWDPYDQNASAPFFNPAWMFNVDRGFDIVIGNPPYVRQEKIKERKPDLKDRYECFTGVADLYVYFYERGMNLLREGGALVYISSNKYFRSAYGAKLRTYIDREASLRRIIDFGDADVFTSIAYPSIIVLSKERTNRGSFQAFNWVQDEEVESFEKKVISKSFSMAQKDLKSDGWRFERRDRLRLMEKLRAAGTPLGEYVKGKLYYGIKTGLNEAFVVNRATRDRLIREHRSSEEVLKPFLRVRDVKRWRVEFAEKYLIKIESSENADHPWSGKKEKEAEQTFAKTYPAIYGFMKPLRRKLVDRADQGKYFWELRSCAYWKEFEQPKIIYPDIYEHQSFAFDSQEYYCGNTCYFIPGQKPWMCALLNASTIEWFYSQISAKVRGGYLRAFSDGMRHIPVIVTDTEKLLSEHVTKLLSMDSPAIASLEPQIDAEVAHLYHLTEEEYIMILKEVDCSDPFRSTAMNAFRDIDSRGIAQ